MAGTLYLVATPIGNLADVSDRVREVLASVSLIGAEDTRRTGVLLKHLDIQTRMTSYHDHNERTKWPKLVERLEADEDIAIVSDAGMPGIADPGWHIVQAALERGIDLTVIPGPTAFVTALVLSGLPVDRFTFEGYLPRKSGRRLNFLRSLVDEDRTMIFYETPYRLEKALVNMVEAFGTRRASVSRELTKIHEETIRGTLPEILDTVQSRSVKGEFVIVVAGAGHSIVPNPDESSDPESSY
jgi:16S rRNA (cytidine1402-2'-O)-methyltransferase